MTDGDAVPDCEFREERTLVTEIKEEITPVILHSCRECGGTCEKVDDALSWPETAELMWETYPFCVATNLFVWSWCPKTAIVWIRRLRARLERRKTLPLKEF